MIQEMLRSKKCDTKFIICPIKWSTESILGKKTHNRLAIWFEMLCLKAKDREKNIIMSIKWLWHVDYSMCEEKIIEK